MTDWTELSRRGALVGHRLVGWIFWEPRVDAKLAELGVGDSFLWSYFPTRAMTLARAGSKAVVAAYGSIDPALIEVSLDNLRQKSTIEAVVAARDEAVAEGLRDYVPEICDGLASMRDDLWAAAEALPLQGRIFAASLLDWPRPDDPLVSAWHAVNVIREWRGDTWWAIQIAEELDGDMSMVLDGAWRLYDDDWLAKSRGSADDAIATAFERLEARGLAADGKVTDAGIDYRQSLEDRLDRITEVPWRHLGEARALEYLELVEPYGMRLMDRIDQTAGPNWMPAGRDRKAR